MRGRFYLICLACMCAGILAGRHTTGGSLSALAACVLLAGLMTMACTRRHTRVLAIPVAFLVAGVLLMSATAWRIRNGTLCVLAGRRPVLSVEGRMVSEAVKRGVYTSFFLEVHSVRARGAASGCRERVLATVEGLVDDSRYYPGANVRVRGKLAPGGRSAEWLLDHGAGCILNVSPGGLGVGPSPPDPVSRLVETVRRWISKSYRAVFAKDTAGFMEGVTLSKLGGMDEGLQEDLKACGLSHIVAVSGLHVGSAALLMLALAGAAGAGRRGRYAAASLMALLVMALSNFRPSSSRACAMALAGFTGRLTGRRYDPLAGLSIAGILIVGVNCRGLFDPGLQMSFAAALAIIVVLPGLKKASATRSLLAVCAAAQLGILPLMLARGEQFPVTAVAANLMVVPVTGVLLVSGWAVAALFPLSAISAKCVAVIPAATSRYVIYVASMMSNVPVAGLFGAPASALSFLMYVVALVWIIRRARAGRGIMAPAAACALAVLITLAPCVLPPRAATADRVAVLDVGEGDAILLTDHTGAAVLVDGGPDQRVIKRKLEERGIRKLDLVVLSHPHEDHVAGLAGLVFSIPIGTILDPGLASDCEDHRKLMEAAEARRIPRATGREGQTIRISQVMELEVLYAPGDLKREPDDLNDCSLVIMARIGRMRALLCGDIGPEAIETLVGRHPDLRADVLKVPHHGARESSSNELLSASRPSVAVISAGTGNKFGHPSGRCIELLKARGIEVARTDRQGDVEVSVHNDRIGLVTDRR